MFFCVCVCVCVCVAKDLANHHHIDIVFLFSKAFHMSCEGFYIFFHPGEISQKNFMFLLKLKLKMEE